MIPEFYRGRNVFITGASGFMGKVLVEKLLWSCEDIGNIYILIRPQKGVDPSKRVEEMCKTPAFERLRINKPSTLSKIIPINGDVSEINLGLSENDRKLLEDHVSIVFHAASSVRFDDPLKKSTLINVRGTREILELAKNMKKLTVLVYISTSYCNCNQKTVEEKVIKNAYGWKEMISLIENGDDQTINILEPKIINKRPNTYTFTKSLAENVIVDYSADIPCIIVRPSIVSYSCLEPLPGWIDNLNGPTGIFVGTLTGILHVIFAKRNITSDYMPCDYAINGIIVASWYKATSDSNECIVVNCASGSKISVGPSDIINHIDQGMKNHPPSKIIWYPSLIITENRYSFYLLFVLTHILPGLFIDMVLKMNKKIKFSLTRLYRRIFRASIALEYFTTNEWNILTHRYYSMIDNLSPADKETFKYDPEDLNINEVMKIGVKGLKKYIFQESESNLDADRRKGQIFKWVHYTFKYGFMSYFSWNIIKLFVRLVIDNSNN